MNKKVISTLTLFVLSFGMYAQTQPLTIAETLNLAIENNSGLKASSLKIDEADALIKSAFNFDKTSIFYSYDENNMAINGEPLKVFGVSQDFKFPTVYLADKKVNKAQSQLQQSSHDIVLQQLKRDVYLAYYDLSFVKNKTNTYKYLDSLYQDFAKAAKRRFELGETNYLEMITAQSKQKQLETLLKQSQQEVVMQTERLKKVVQKDDIAIVDEPLLKLELDALDTNTNVGLLYFESSKSYYKARYQQEKQQILPDLNVEYFQGSNSGMSDQMRGYQFGLKIPLLFSGNSSRIKASKIAQDIVEQQQQDYQVKLAAEYQALLAELQQYNEAIAYYDAQGKHLSEEIIKTAERTLKEGEIDFFQYIQSIETAMDIELTYLNNLNLYNQTIITLNYLIL